MEPLPLLAWDWALRFEASRRSDGGTATPDTDEVELPADRACCVRVWNDCADEPETPRNDDADDPSGSEKLALTAVLVLLRGLSWPNCCFTVTSE